MSLENKIEGMLDILDGRIAAAEFKDEKVKQELEYLRKRFIALLNGKDTANEKEKDSAYSDSPFVGYGGGL